MSRYQGYSDPLEVLIDILSEMKEIKELLNQKQMDKPTTEDKIKVIPRRSRNANKS